jgi:hypothetical protein
VRVEQPYISMVSLTTRISTWAHQVWRTEHAGWMVTESFLIGDDWLRDRAYVLWDSDRVQKMGEVSPAAWVRHLPRPAADLHSAKSHAEKLAVWKIDGRLLSMPDRNPDQR